MKKILLFLCCGLITQYSHAQWEVLWLNSIPVIKTDTPKAIEHKPIENIITAPESYLSVFLKILHARRLYIQSYNIETYPVTFSNLIKSNLLYLDSSLYNNYQHTFLIQNDITFGFQNNKMIMHNVNLEQCTHLTSLISQQNSIQSFTLNKIDFFKSKPNLTVKSLCHSNNTLSID